MNPSTAHARVLIDEWVRAGVTDIVLCPGSRSAALAFAVRDADQAGQVRLHVRIDERGAAFLALGLARATGRPSPVICTSGTAVANLHPAVLEAHHSGIPMLLVTADRPAELQGVSANQATTHVGIFGEATRLVIDMPPATTRIGEVGYWRSSAARSYAAAIGAVTGNPGPVHLNVAFREPLVPTSTNDWVEPLAPRKGPWLATSGPAKVAGEPLNLDRHVRTVIVAGDGAGPHATWLAESSGWPVLAEPSSGSWGGSACVAGAPYVAGSEPFRTAHDAQRIIVMGRPTLGRSVLAMLARRDAELIVVGSGSQWPDPMRRVSTVTTEVALHGRVLHAWSESWRAAGARVWLALGEVLADRAGDGSESGLGGRALAEPLVARTLVSALPSDSHLFVGSSQPIRDIHLCAAPRDDLHVHANRGLAGIDGLISTASGIALGAGAARSYALVGDLGFLHDVSALVRGRDEPQPNLTVVVIDNDGGGIFGLLEQGDPQFAPSFERVFGTPHGRDLVAVCEAFGVPVRSVSSADALAAAIANDASDGAGLRVIHVRTDRVGARQLHQRLRRAADAVLQ